MLVVTGHIILSCGQQMLILRATNEFVWWMRWGLHSHFRVQVLHQYAFPNFETSIPTLCECCQHRLKPHIPPICWHNTWTGRRLAWWLFMNQFKLWNMLLINQGCPIWGGWGEPPHPPMKTCSRPSQKFLVPPLTNFFLRASCTIYHLFVHHFYK